MKHFSKFLSLTIGGVSLCAVLAGCGNGNNGALSSLTGAGSGEQTLDFGSLTTRIAGTAQPPVTSAGSGSTVTGIAGAFITSMSLKISPSDLNKTKITFFDDKEGLYEVYSMNTDGTDLKNLSNMPSFQDTYPSWSPDGTKIAFGSNRSGNYDLWIMNADGSNPVNITPNTPTSSEGFPRWSSDSSKIVFMRTVNGNQDIYVMNANGSNQTALATNPENDQYPDFSPDGTKIVYLTLGKIYTMNASNGSNKVQLANGYYPTWSPDGRKIAFQDSGIFVMNADGTGIIRLTASTNNDADAHWSVDGKKIIFTRNVSNVITVHTINASSGTELTALYQSPGQLGSPRWSWATLNSRNLIGTGGTLATTAAGFLYGRNGDTITSLLVFDATDTTRSSARIATTTGIGVGLSNYSFTITHPTALTSLSFTNDLYASPTVVIGTGGLAAVSSAIVDYNAGTGRVIAVIPFESVRSAETTQVEGDIFRHRGKLLGVWTADGKNAASNGASEVEVNAETGAVRIVR